MEVNGDLEKDSKSTQADINGLLVGKFPFAKDKIIKWRNNWQN